MTTTLTRVQATQMATDTTKATTTLEEAIALVGTHLATTIGATHTGNITTHCISFTQSLKL